MNERILIEPESYFWLRSGQPLKSLQELALQLPLISDEDFSHHVQPGKNDFAQWVRELFAEHELAAALEQCSSRAQMQTVLYNHIMRSWIREKQEQLQPEQPQGEPEVPVDLEELWQRHWRY